MALLTTRFVVLLGLLGGGDKPSDLPNESAEGKSFSARVATVSAWFDGMPVVGGSPDSRTHLVVSIRLKNTTDRPLDVTLDRTLLAFRSDDKGRPTGAGLSLDDDKNQQPPPADDKKRHVPPTVRLEPGESRTVKYRGKGLFASDAIGKSVYLTLELSAGQDKVAVRGSSKVKHVK